VHCRRLRLALVGLLGASALFAGGGTAGAATPVTFTCTGGGSGYTAPAGVDALELTVVGAAGGAGAGVVGGRGASVTVRVELGSGPRRFVIAVGCPGGTGQHAATRFPDGGAGGSGAGGGGGSSIVSRCREDVCESSRGVVSAGGGGGGGAVGTTGASGGRGGDAAHDGSAGRDAPVATAGGGGSAATEGRAGRGGSAGAPGGVPGQTRGDYVGTTGGSTPGTTRGGGGGGGGGGLTTTGGGAGGGSGGLVAGQVAGGGGGAGGGSYTAPDPDTTVLTPVGPASGPARVTVTPVDSAPHASDCAYTDSGSDLNGDGFDDAVVGNPHATVNGRKEAGTITVLFGDADGRIGEGARRTLDQAGVGGSAVEAGDHFGWSVAMDDVDLDGCADVLVGSPGEDWDGRTDAGMSHLVSFPPAASVGVATTRSRVLSQATTGGSVEAGDRFGSTVAVGDARAEGGARSVAAVGAPGEDVGHIRDAGAVNTFAVADRQVVDPYELRQGRGPLSGAPETGDRFGAALLLALLDLPPGFEQTPVPRWAFVVGAPGDTVSGADSAGSVTVVEAASTSEPAGTSSAQYTQDTEGVPGAAEPGDEFGFSLAVGEPRGFRDPPRRRDLVVGAPGEDVRSVVDAGSVTLFTHASGRLQPRQALTQDTHGVAGAAEAGDRFGDSVAIRPAETHLDALLAVGVPDEDISQLRDAGLAQLFSLRNGSVSYDRSLSENTAGTPGTVSPGNRFSQRTAAMQGGQETLLAFSSPYQRSGSVFVTAVDRRSARTSSRSWVPGNGGVPPTTGRFGWSLSGLESGG
jgi:hypothetical protein